MTSNPKQPSYTTGTSANGDKPAATDDADYAVLTIGHSTRPIDEFIALLQAHGVRRLLDVRTVPRSRHNPQFNTDALPPVLASAGIGYEHVKGLGGFRHTRADSPNGGWRNLSFRGYADYMQTAEFAHELKALIERSQRERVALMCAEAVPWRCHRSLVADALLAQGVASAEIASATRLQAHRLTSFAKVDGKALSYPPGAEEEGGDEEAAPAEKAEAKKPAAPKKESEPKKKTKKTATKAEAGSESKKNT